MMNVQDINNRGGMPGVVLNWPERGINEWCAVITKQEGGDVNNGFPNGFGDEEAYGLNSIQLGDRPGQPHRVRRHRGVPVLTSSAARLRRIRGRAAGRCSR